MVLVRMSKDLFGLDLVAKYYGKPADEQLISKTMLTRDCGIPEMTPETAVYVTTCKDITPQFT